MTAVERPPYDAAIFAPGPARDARFAVKEQWVDCHNLPAGDPEREVEFFHRQMNEEVNGMECAARNLADFPNAEWELRMHIAKLYPVESALQSGGKLSRAGRQQ